MSNEGNSYWFRFFSAKWVGSIDVQNMDDSDRGIYIQTLACQHMFKKLPLTPKELKVTLKSKRYRSVVKFLKGNLRLLDIKMPDGTRWVPEDHGLDTSEAPVGHQQGTGRAQAGTKQGTGRVLAWTLKDAEFVKLLPCNCTFTIPKFNELQEIGQKSGKSETAERKKDKKDNKESGSVSCSELMQGSLAKSGEGKPKPTSSKPKPLWNQWEGEGPVKGIPEMRIRYCIYYLLHYNDWYKDKLTNFGFVHRMAERMDEDTPKDYCPSRPVPKEVVPIPDPACLKCRGTGQLKARFVKVEGQKIEQTVIPDCDCLRRETK